MSFETQSRPAETAIHGETMVRYIAPDCDGGILYEQQREASTLVFDSRRVRLLDARRAAAPPALETHGFELVRHIYRFAPGELTEGVINPDGTPYATSIAKLVRRMTGASEVLVFHQAVRDEGQQAAAKPAHTAHVDFDRKTLESFVRASRSDAERLLSKRMSNINLWRGLKPVERTPLAVCEGGTIAPEDLRVGHIRMKPDVESPPMSGFNIAYSARHRWWIYPQMQPDELLVIRLYDSDPDAVQLSAHTAVDDPAARPDAPPRRSLEVRTLAFFD